ncbi:DUF6074 family protein [Devosia sp. SD17-2]|uniref:DUF6074 family protein n=1 Tax=Devosia sp. SD17-2 TaxID=2976459 RepID=UPI0023D81C75|nr:DUF6074 family protein [Devosia sp. SD17-2]WEJ31999.1 DUF6074 family protein [Devosia sp. SD17-2]
MKPEQLDLFPGSAPAISVAKKAPEQVLPKVVALKRTDDKSVNGPMAKDCSTVPFPANRLVAHVRRVARAMDARDDRLATKYLRTERNRLIGRLQAQGFPLSVATAEGDHFADAVAHQRSKPRLDRQGDAA